MTSNEEVVRSVPLPEIKRLFFEILNKYVLFLGYVLDFLQGYFYQYSSTQLKILRNMLQLWIIAACSCQSIFYLSHSPSRIDVRSLLPSYPKVATRRQQYLTLIFPCASRQWRLWWRRAEQNKRKHPWPVAIGRQKSILKSSINHHLSLSSSLLYLLWVGLRWPLPEEQNKSIMPKFNFRQVLFIYANERQRSARMG